MILRSMVIHFVVYLVGLNVAERFTVSSHEHPASAFSWFLPPVFDYLSMIHVGELPFHGAKLSHCGENTLHLAICLRPFSTIFGTVSVEEGIHIFPWRVR